MDLDSPFHCLTFSLQRASRALVQGFEAAMAGAGLTAPQFTTLSLLAGFGPQGMGQLAARLGTDRTTLTRNLARLAASGSIAPAPGSDRRQNLWVITDTGRQRLAQAMPAWRAFQARLVAALGADGAEALMGELARLSTAAQPRRDTPT
jgi:DNA-binding MarR family transcriptional regulator